MQLPPSANNPKGTERPNTIGLESHKLELILNHLDASTSEARPNKKRNFARWPFRRTAIKVTILHPGGSEVSLRLACRNLSRGGIGVLHTAFVHPGSVCSVELPTGDGAVDRVAGVVVRCMHRRGTLHEVGIRFTRPIDLGTYVPRESEYMPALEKVDPSKLAGSVLCIDPSDPEVDELRTALRDTVLSLRHVRTGAEALAEDFSKFALIVCERTLPDMSGLELLRKVRGSRVMTPAILLSHQGWAPGEVTDRLCAWAQKPVDPALMLRIIAELQMPEGETRKRGAA